MAQDKYIQGISADSIDWKFLTSILPEVANPNPLLGRNTLLHELALFRNENEDFGLFLDNFFKHPAIQSALDEKDMIGNTPFLWAVSRVNCVDNSNIDFISANVNVDFYNSYHPFSLYVMKFYEHICQNPSLIHLLYAPNWNNTPLLLAIKNGNIELALKLIPHYPLEALQQKTNMGNTALHLASFFRMDTVISAILKRAEELNAKDQVLGTTTRTGYTAFDCYSIDLIDQKSYEELRQNTESIKYSIQALRNKSQVDAFFKGISSDDIRFFVSADILISFNSDQESAHPYSKLRRTTFNQEICTALKTNIPPKILNPSHQTILVQKPKVIFKFDSKKIAIKAESMEKIGQAFLNEYPGMKIAYLTEAYMSEQDYYVHAYIDPKIDTTPITVYKILPNNNVLVYHNTTEKYFDKTTENSCSTQITLSPHTEKSTKPPLTTPINTEDLSSSSTDELDDDQNEARSRSVYMFYEDKTVDKSEYTEVCDILLDLIRFYPEMEQYFTFDQKRFRIEVSATRETLLNCIPDTAKLGEKVRKSLLSCKSVGIPMNGIHRLHQNNVANFLFCFSTSTHDVHFTYTAQYPEAKASYEKFLENNSWNRVHRLDWGQNSDDNTFVTEHFPIDDEIFQKQLIVVQDNHDIPAAQQWIIDNIQRFKADKNCYLLVEFSDSKDLETIKQTIKRMAPFFSFNAREVSAKTIEMIDRVSALGVTVEGGENERTLYIRGNNERRLPETDYSFLKNVLEILHKDKDAKIMIWSGSSHGPGTLNKIISVKPALAHALIFPANSNLSIDPQYPNFPAKDTYAMVKTEAKTQKNTGSQPSTPSSSKQDTTTDEEGNNLLHLAAKKGNFDEYKLLADKHPELISAVNKKNRTPLFVATDPQIIADLIQRNPESVKHTDQGGSIPLQALLFRTPSSMSEKDNNNIKAFIDGGSDISFEYNNHESLALYLAFHANNDVITSMIEAGVDLTKKLKNDYENEYTIPVYALMRPYVLAIDPEIFRDHIKGEAKDLGDTASLLHYAAFNGMTDLIESLVHVHHLNVNEPLAEGGETPLLLAIEQHGLDSDIVKKLISCGATMPKTLSPGEQLTLSMLYRKEFYSHLHAHGDAASFKDFINLSTNNKKELLPLFFNLLSLKNNPFIDELKKNAKSIKDLYSPFYHSLTSNLYSQLNWTAYQRAKFTENDLAGLSKLKLKADEVKLSLQDQPDLQNALFNLMAYAGKLALEENPDSYIQNKVSALTDLVNRLLSTDDPDEINEILEEALKNNAITKNRGSGLYVLYSIFRADKGNKWNTPAKHVVRSTAEELLLKLKISFDKRNLNTADNELQDISEDDSDTNSKNL